MQTLPPTLLNKPNEPAAPIENKPHPYSIRKLPIQDPDFVSETPVSLQNKDLPGFPTVVIIVGEPGSGKTTLLINFLVREDLWRGFFDKIFYLGPTIKADQTYKLLKIPDERVVTDQDEFIPKLQEWADEQREAVEHDRKLAPKCLFIFEDITSYYHTAQASPDFAKCFNTIRHHKSTVVANIHKFKALNRTARQSGRHIILFPISDTEVKQVADDYIPHQLTRNDFMIMCQMIWEPDEKQERPFLYINKHCDMKKRYRRCFTDVIDVTWFKGIDKKQKNAGQYNPNRDMKLSVNNTISDKIECNHSCMKCCKINGKKRKNTVNPKDNRAKRSRNQSSFKDESHLKDPYSKQVGKDQNEMISQTSVTKPEKLPAFGYLR